MVRRKRPVLATGSQHQRKVARRKLGKLSATVVKSQTVLNYRKATRLFFLYLVQFGLALGASLVEFDEQICSYIDYVWQNGDSKEIVSNLLCGLQHFVPGVKNHLQGSWRLVNAWGKLEMPTRATPLTPTMLWAFSAYLSILLASSSSHSPCSCGQESFS